MIRPFYKQHPPSRNIDKSSEDGTWLPVWVVVVVVVVVG